MGAEEEKTIACLLPARNAEADLPGFMASVASVCDLVIALDDGSDDGTREGLEASPLVRSLLTNPRRTSHAGWDDRANRQRLLDAAAELGVGWVVFLDADERLDPEDAAALRDFLQADAIPGCAYGLQLFRCWDGDRCHPPPTYVYRAFALRPEAVLPQERLHFNPVPTAIRSSAWVKTTVRVRHLDSPERLQRRRLKYREADPDGEWERGPGPRLEPPADELVRWRARAPGLPVMAVGEELERSTFDLVRERRPSLACLLPVRNGAESIPGYLQSVARFADAVIALDDGSTDNTAELLSAEPLVRELLDNPRRETFAGWDDAANRQRLLDAAVAAGHDWVLFLDADERIDADDAAALRAFVDHAADPDRAYGFRVFRMTGPSAYDRAALWVYRLFAPREGHLLPRQTLHLVPVPTAIRRPRWRKTTIRIQHLGALDPATREARLRKYDEADPDRRWQRDYASLLDEGGEPRRWAPRPPGLPALATPAATLGSNLDLEALGEGPLISAIVISRDDEHTIERCVGSVVGQDCPVPFEVIVVASGTDRTAEIVSDRFPQVRLVRLRRPALPGAARNAGLAVARGEYVSFPGSHVELGPGSLAARFEAHELGYPMVTGTIVNGTTTRAGWATYFLDHSGSLPGRPSEELAAAPSHCSYAHDVLLEVGGFPDVRAGEDTAVNNELWRRGYGAYRAAGATLIHHSRCRTVRRLVRHHFQRGRALGAVLRGDFRAGRPASRRFLVGFLARYPRRRVRDIGLRVALWGEELEGEYRHARALVALGALAAWLGALSEVTRRRPVPRQGSDWRARLFELGEVVADEDVVVAELTGEPDDVGVDPDVVAAD